MHTHTHARTRTRTLVFSSAKYAHAPGRQLLMPSRAMIITSSLDCAFSAPTRHCRALFSAACVCVRVCVCVCARVQHGLFSAACSAHPVQRGLFDAACVKQGRQARAGVGMCVPWCYLRTQVGGSGMHKRAGTCRQTSRAPGAAARCSATPAQSARIGKVWVPCGQRILQRAKEALSDGLQGDRAGTNQTPAEGCPPTALGQQGLC